MFGTSGIRGPVGEEVTAALGLRLGRAVGSDADVSRAVVGRDPRASGIPLGDALSAGFREVGVDVVRLGIAATPTIARAVGSRGADVGVAVTASHNPPPDNGFKLWNPNGQAYRERQREAVTERLEAGTPDLVGAADMGSESRWDGAADAHRAALLEAVDGGADADAKADVGGGAETDLDLDVIVDVGNGAGGLTADALVALGCRVETLNAQPDGRFPGRPSEPTAETCSSLTALVGATGADLGIAHDGDADRTMAVDDRGRFVSGDDLLAVFARHAVEAASPAHGGQPDDGPGPTVAVPIDTSRAVREHLRAVGGDVVRTRVGDTYVAEAVTEPGVVFGGEPSGAWIWPAGTLCPDGPLAAVRLAALAAERPLSERVDAVPTYPIVRESVAVDDGDKRAVMARVAERAAEAYDDPSTLDGVRVDTDAGWFLVRASGTQPLIRVTAEGETEADATALLADARALLDGS
ncbi:phosphoglucosamine mutase [Halorubrum sp. JWXQ-INN 858]|uniref:phosphoglucosamine mutase n=1 Tax=Halorubrum sp. JWXQ-INN 858 TaxID=2690782 RepID=UPI0013592AB8|nr:phosphoglucosamine mutase [Halorubrum sp. JWXQ-INN 858]MWV65251.1 phosphoglucosamine mutase [Halorubrum sp. JWXQ-INN 858]